MNIEKHYKVLGWLWLVFGGGISVSLSVRLFQYVLRFGFDATDAASRSFLIGITVTFMTFLSGWALFKQYHWGRIAIFIISLIYVFYNFLYFSFHGAEEEGGVTTIIVLCLLVLGLYSFFFLLITGREKNNNAV
jgi:glycopeptide antibiotics resistance protein